MGMLQDIAKLPFTLAAAPVKGGMILWNKSPKGLKIGAIGTLAAAAAIGYAGYNAVTGRERGHRFREDEQAVIPLPPMLTPQDLVVQPSAAELSGPAEGRAPGEWVARTRGTDQQRAAQQPGIDPSMNVQAI